jgi:hypothetical protein
MPCLSMDRRRGRYVLPFRLLADLTSRQCDSCVARSTESSCLLVGKKCVPCKTAHRVCTWGGASFTGFGKASIKPARPSTSQGPSSVGKRLYCLRSGPR